MVDPEMVPVRHVDEHFPRPFAARQKSANVVGMVADYAVLHAGIHGAAQFNGLELR